MQFDKNFTLGLITGLIAALALAIAYFSYEEQKRDNRLDELLGVIALDEEKRAEYLTNKKVLIGKHTRTKEEIYAQYGIK